MLKWTKTEIGNFTDLYHKAVAPDEMLSPFINGHLVLEFMLRKLVSIYDPALTPHADSLNHYRLIKLNNEIGTISDLQRDVLLKINQIRNKFAHDLIVRPSTGELRALFRDAQAAFSDFGVTPF